MEKIDYKQKYKALYAPLATNFTEVDVPCLHFVKIDGVGDPNKSAEYQSAVEWLFGVSYTMKFAAKSLLNRDYVVPPLETLWWTDDPSHFVQRAKARWKWTAMIMAPTFLTDEMFKAAASKTAEKRGDTPSSLRLEPYDEGRSLQILHIGPYDDEAPTIARLHDEIMPAQELIFNGPHHEIYLSDPRKVEASKLKTILRQPVRS